jgi:hypothetical protein
MATADFESVLRDAQRLTPHEQRRLLEELQTLLIAPPNSGAAVGRGVPLRSLYGALTDLGPGPSAEEIDEARREAWANFPADDV